MYGPIRYWSLIIICLFFLCCKGAKEEASIAPLQMKKPVPDSKQIELATVKDGRFVSNEGQFSINIPEMPLLTRTESPTRFSKKGDAFGKQYFWRFENTVYTAMYSPLNSAKSDPQDQTLSDMSSGVWKGIKRQSGEYISETPITFGKFRGFETRYRSAEGMRFISRNYLMDEFGYQIVGAYFHKSDEKKVIEVLDSFKLLSNAE